MADESANQTAALSALSGRIEATNNLMASAAMLITGLAEQIRTAQASDDSDALTKLADNLDQHSQALAAAVAANTPQSAGGNLVTNPDTAPLMSGGIAPNAHATSPVAPPASGPVNTDPSAATNLGHGTVTPASGLTPVEDLPAAMQPGDDAPAPVETPVVADGLDPAARSPNPSATTDNFPDADPAANHIDPDPGQPVVSPPGVDPGTGAAIPTTEAIPVDVVRDETTDAPAPADETTDAPVSPPVIDPATGQPVQLDPATSAPTTDTSDATSGGPTPGPVDSPGAPL